MRAITWVELNGVHYGVLSRAGQVIPEGKPNYGVIAYEIHVHPEDGYSGAGCAGFHTGSIRATSLRIAQAKCEAQFKDWLDARGLLAQIDLDYDRVFAAIAGLWRDLGTIAERIGTEITYDRILSALKLLIADGKVEIKDGGDGRAPMYRATLV